MPKYENKYITCFYYLFFNLNFLIMKKIIKASIVILFFLAANIGYGMPMTVSNNANIDKSLVEQLAQNANFESYTVGIVNLFNKIIDSKSQDLFSKFIKKQATETETDILLEKLGYKNINEFNQISKDIINNAKIVFSYIPKIAKATDEERKKIIQGAFEIVSKKESFKKAIYSHTYYTCWAWWTACITGCAISYPDGGNDYWTCFFVCDAIFSVCYVTAEQ